MLFGRQRRHLLSCYFSSFVSKQKEASSRSLFPAALQDRQSVHGILCVTNFIFSFVDFDPDTSIGLNPPTTISKKKTL